MAWANGTRQDSGHRLYVGNSPLEIVRNRRVNANLYTVAVAFGDMTEGNASNAQIEAAAWLVHYIRHEIFENYRTLMPITRNNMVGHNQVMPRTACPGVNFPFDRIIRRANDTIPK
jgi:N-acetyl-anhydromuramyl-L-alanine amidase AmpD